MRELFLGVVLLCSVVLLCGVVSNVEASCPSNALASLSFVLEHAVWRGWHQAIIYTPDLEPGCRWATVRLVKCLAVNGVASAVDSLAGARVHAKLGIIILSPRIKPNATDALSNLIKKLNELEMNTASYDWLLAARSDQDFKYINQILNASSIRFDQNIMVSYPFYKHRPEDRSLGLCDINFVYTNNHKVDMPLTQRRIHNNRQRYYNRGNNCKSGNRDPNCIKTEYERNYYRASRRFRNLTKTNTFKKSGNVLPLYQTGVINYNYSKLFIMTNISAWTPEQSMSQVDTPYPAEARNFLGEELRVGRCNSSGEGAGGEEDGPAAPASVRDVLLFLTVRLNATSVTRYYSKLGFRSHEGVWTGLLGALMDRSVDLALEPVTAHPARHQDLDFIFPIAETMCNIYIRHQETSTVRDIFLAPFSPRLVASVVAVAVVAALALVLIGRLSATLRAEPRPLGYTEALIWATGILCQQGGSWTPPNPAASVLLIACLFFAVVTYNAYAAFITSVLSVRVASLDTVAAVLHSPDFKIGYIRNGADQMYLMSTKDAQLNAFYIRGYSDAENLVTSAEEGLARAARQDYAFFAGQRAARTTLRSLSQARGRCAVRELPVPSTRAQLAFPLPRRSPYARPILVGLLQLRSGGALARLEAALVPAMPQCEPPPGFASARATDVRSALILLLVGLVTALLLGVGEFCWKNRRELRDFLARGWRRLLSLISKW